MQTAPSNTFTVSKEIEFDAGHRVPDHDGKCSNPHGHRYKVILTVAGELQPDGSARGMVLDFGDIKKVLQIIHDRYDHGFIISHDDSEMYDALISFNQKWKVVVVPFSPTAEELARWCFNFARTKFEDMNLAGTLLSCTVYETPTSAASYGL